MLADQKAACACGPDCIHAKIDNHTASDNDKFLTLTTDLDVSTYVWDIIKGSRSLTAISFFTTSAPKVAPAI
jgi:hypothetical protein